MNKKLILIVFFILVFVFLVCINSQVFAAETVNYTRAYFCSEITKGYGNGDCILLENVDSNGNRIWGLIDSGRKIEVNDNGSTVVKEFLKRHGVTKLDFFAITHSHSDHNGDALTVLEMVKAHELTIDRIYMKECDSAWSYGCTQRRYEEIIEKAIENNIKIIGISYLSLTDNKVSPSRTESFKLFLTSNTPKKFNFEGFYYNNETDNNIKFKFGSSNIEIYNWEMLDTEGNQYITGKTTDKQRKYVDDENNNSFAFLLIQGNKKAFFTGDMNNKDGTEDRIKDKIGKIDFLKLGHHGYIHSNTENYMNVLLPEYAVVTNDVGGIDAGLNNWLKKHNTKVMYSVVDEQEVSVTITNSNVYFGLTSSFKKINNNLYYIPSGWEYDDYENVSYNIRRENKIVYINGWDELKTAINNNANDIVVNNQNKTCTVYDLKVYLSQGALDTWNIDDCININMWQNIELNAFQEITMKRGSDHINSPLFYINGELSINGNITLDGNNVLSKSSLIMVEDGIVNLNTGVVLCNNYNKKTDATIVFEGLYSYHDVWGSGIYVKNGICNINGAKIINNKQEIDTSIYENSSWKLPTVTSNNISFSTCGCGIFLMNNSTLNMKDGIVSNNIAINNTIVTTKQEKTIIPSQVGQLCRGVGIYAMSNSSVNLIGGEIKDNQAINNSRFVFRAATNGEEKSYIKLINNGIDGVGIFVSNSKMNISNNCILSSNNGTIGAKDSQDKFILETNTEAEDIKARICGNQFYINNTEFNIEGLTARYGIVNNSNISTIINGEDRVDSKNCGGGILINSSNGTIKNSSISGNNSSYGAGIYTNGESDVRIENIEITQNTAELSGGGIFENGKTMLISGYNTIINNNMSNTYGGGIYTNKYLIVDDGKIIGNTAKDRAGGGIYSNGKLVINGGEIEYNTAKTTGGGIDCSRGSLLINRGSVANNTANSVIDNIYPKYFLNYAIYYKKINSDVKVLAGFEFRTTISQVLEKFDTSNYIVKIYDSLGNEIKDMNQIVGTGYKVELYENGELIETYIIVIYGDTNGDGKLEASDALTIVKNKIKSKEFINEYYQEAGRTTKSTRENSSVPSSVDALAVIKQKLYENDKVINQTFYYAD